MGKLKPQPKVKPKAPLLPTPTTTIKRNPKTRPAKA
jgi:hypothetical protein